MDILGLFDAYMVINLLTFQHRSVFKTFMIMKVFQSENDTIQYDVSHKMEAQYTTIYCASQIAQPCMWLQWTNNNKSRKCDRYVRGNRKYYCELHHEWSQKDSFCQHVIKEGDRTGAICGKPSYPKIHLCLEHAKEEKHFVIIPIYVCLIPNCINKSYRYRLCVHHYQRYRCQHVEGKGGCYLLAKPGWKKCKYHAIRLC